MPQDLKLASSKLMIMADMRFVKNFTPPDFQAKKITSLISPYFNSFGEKTHKKMSENGEIYSVGKKFTLPPAVTAVTNLTSGSWLTTTGYASLLKSQTTIRCNRRY